jgi:hypothetical protein
VTPTVSTAYAAYFLASYKLTVVGTANVQPPASYNGGVASVDGYYKQTASSFIPVTVTGSCPAGAAPTGLLVTTSSGSTVMPNPSVITMNKPTTVTVQCPPPSPLASCTPAPAGMVGWFPLDETSGTVAGNLGSLGVPGTVIGSTTPVAGRVAGARNFSGGGYVEVNDPNAFNVGTGDFSMDAWVRGTGAALGNGTHFIAGKQWPQSGVVNGYLLAVHQGRLRFHMSDGAVAVNASGGPVLADGQWHHVAVTVGRGKDAGTLYVDGVKVSAFDASIAPNSLNSSNRFRIGKLQQQDPFTGTAFAGVIDEVEIFNRAVTADEIGRIFAAGAFGKCKGVTPPVVHTVTLAGCGLTATSAVNSVSTNPLTYPAGTQLVLRANPATGQTLNGIKVTMGGVTTNYTANPVSVALNGNAVVTADCGCVEPPQKANLTTWYPLNEKSMPVRDIAGTETAANATGTPQFTAGKIGGGGILISGVSWLDAANAVEGDIGTGNFSIDLWVKTSVATGTQTFIDKRVNRNVPQTRGYSFYLLNGRLGFQMADGSGDTATAICGTGANASCTNFEAPGSTVNVADGNWHLVAVTVNRTGGAAGGKLYVDGNVVHTFNPAVRAGSLSNTTPLRMGNHGNASLAVGSGFAGEIDEVEVFTAELTGAEVMGLYAAEVSGKCVTTPQPACADLTKPTQVPPMAAWWSFDPATALTAVDRSGNGNTATLHPVRNPATFVGPAFAMDASTYMWASDSPSLRLGSGPFSMDMWVRWPANTSPGLNPSLVSKWSATVGAPGKGYGFALGPQQSGATWSSGLTLTMMDGVDSVLYTWETPKSVIPADGQWHLVGVTFTPPTGTAQAVVKFYVDGNPVTTSASGQSQGRLTPIDTDSAAFLYGGLIGLPGPQLKYLGDIDEVEIFKGVLTDEQMKRIADAGANGKCPLTTTPPVTVNVKTAVNGTVTNAGLQITVDNFNYTDSRSYTAPGGSTHTHITQSQVAGGYYYTFNGWTPGTTAGMQQVTLPASGTADYVANFTRSGIVVTVNNTAQCAVGVAPASLYMIPPPPIVMPIGIPFLVTAVAGSPSGFTISVGGAAPVSYASFQSQVGPFSAPITITPQCSTTVTHTVTTAPAGLQVTIDGGTPVAAPQTVSWAAGSAHTLGAPTPQLNAAGDIQYTLQNWTPAGPAIASAPASATTYTANFSTAYKVTVTLNGCTNTNTAGIPAGGGSVFVPAGSSFVTTVSASAGQVILSATVNGAAQTVSG